MQQIDAIDTFANGLMLKATNGGLITVVELQKLLADAAARPLLYEEKERIRKGMSLLSCYRKIHLKHGECFYLERNRLDEIAN